MGEIRILFALADLGGTGVFVWCLIRLGWMGLLDILVIAGWLDPTFAEEERWRWCVFLLACGSGSWCFVSG